MNTYLFFERADAGPNMIYPPFIITEISAKGLLGFVQQGITLNCFVEKIKITLFLVYVTEPICALYLYIMLIASIHCHCYHDLASEIPLLMPVYTYLSFETCICT